MVNEQEFVDQRRSSWQELQRVLDKPGGLARLRPLEVSQAVQHYRNVCADLMRARTASFSPQLVGHLDALVALAHNQLYGTRHVAKGQVGDILLRAFPRALRAASGFFWLATALFVVPLALGVATALLRPDLATSFLPAQMLEQAAQSYAQGLQGRNSGVDAAMAGFYVWNNVGIAFRCFATGILFGIGSLFFLIYNGLYTGITLGWVIGQGHGEHILTFVTGHGAFELTAICIAGAAGLKMGDALVRTDGRTRLASLRAQAPALGALISGTAVMLLIAAVIEGFWSPSSAPPPVKWTVAAGLWLAVAAYLALAGRERRPTTAREQR